jgi:hypothetical protein
MKGEVAMTMDDTNWQARSDLRTLVEAGKIKKDSKRLAAAKAEAKRQMAEATIAVADMKK